jgi:hypothetical protein
MARRSAAMWIRFSQVELTGRRRKPCTIPSLLLKRDGSKRPRRVERTSAKDRNTVAGPGFLKVVAGARFGNYLPPSPASGADRARK